MNMSGMMTTPLMRLAQTMARQRRASSSLLPSSLLSGGGRYRYAPPPLGAHRAFFWGSGSSSSSGSSPSNKDDDDGNGEEKKNPAPFRSSKYIRPSRPFFSPKSRRASNQPSDSSSSSSFPNSDGDSSGSSSSSSSSSSSGSGASLPSVPQVGDNAPRPPFLFPLGVNRRPLLPGTIGSIKLTDRAVIDKIEQLIKGDSGEGGGGSGTGRKGSRRQQPLIGIFLRKDTSSYPSGSDDDSSSSSSSSSKSSSSKSGNRPAPPPPERVYSASNELRKVGVLATVHSLTRLPKSGVSALNSSGDGSSSTASVDDEGESATLLVISHRRVRLDEKEDGERGTKTNLPAADADANRPVKVEHMPPNVYKAVPARESSDGAGSASSSHDDPDDLSPEMLKALANEVISLLREVVSLNPLLREGVASFLAGANNVAGAGTSGSAFGDPLKLADFAVGLTSASETEVQQVLEEMNAKKRLNLVVRLLTNEIEISKIQTEIKGKIAEEMGGNQRKYFLKEQLKLIKKELGEEVDDKAEATARFTAKIDAAIKLAGGEDKIPKDALSAMRTQLDRLSTLDQNSGEFNLVKSYLEWLTCLPYNNGSKENYNLKAAQEHLDKDHYGLSEVKDSILQFVAIGALKNSHCGKIMCLAGPPGVGKTSIGRSVANALGRDFYRFSVGGLSDVSEIKGHRRTYVGAMPGKIIQCLKSVGNNNPVILIDEIDKLGGKHGHNGDPASALLEVLDPSQNKSFVDHYLDVPIDLSKVMFICTANSLETIPGPLLDRMEVIRLSGYDGPEKVAIAEQYLVPKCLEEAGLRPSKKKGEEGKSDPSEIPNPISISPNVGIDTSAVEMLVRWYCREAGVRNLEKHIGKICRQLALRTVALQHGIDLNAHKKTEKKTYTDTWAVSDSNLHEYVGKPVFTSDRMYEAAAPHGVVMGLAWTSMGGSALYIESQVVEKGTAKLGAGGNIKTTGQMGDVMKESVQIAYTNARRILAKYQSGNSFFDDKDVHMHIPEGATPKDGPSAGITMITSLLSLALDRPIRDDIAMTGEVSLTGMVLPIGGVKEKTIAARRAGVRCLIFPELNRRDFEELPGYLRDGLEVHFVEKYQQVFEIAFMEEDFFTKE